MSDWIRSGSRLRWLACFNPHSYVVAKRNDDFGRALRDADWLIPDGVGVVLASRLIPPRIPDRITGWDVFHGVSAALANEEGRKVFFLGSTEATLSAIRERMARDYPALKVAGTYSPPFSTSYGDSEIDRIIEVVNSARPDVLWVGLTAPKQELLLHRIRDRLDVKFAGAIGAVFDFYAGNVRRSSRAFQRLGLEWLPRLVQEPRRLWRRMFVSAPIFVWDVVRERCGRRP